MQKEQPRRPIKHGLGQLSLVEHALCPLDTRTSLKPNLVFDTSYQYSGGSRTRQTAHAKTIAPLGLSASDEFFLWGLLALTFSQANPEPEFHATPHYCLRQLGAIDGENRRGGRQFRHFAQAIERLSTVNYRNDAFYDPVRAEHRQVSFGFLSYSLPQDVQSSRAWRFVWNKLFFEMVSAAGGYFRFDLATYKELDPASRRLFLFLTKVFARCEATPRLELRHLGEHIIGFCESLSTRHIKQKVGSVLDRLADAGVVREGETAIRKESKGRYSVLLTRGPYFERRSHSPTPLVESPLVEPLLAIGFDPAGADRMIRRYPAAVLREWADITLAAIERFGLEFFTSSPAAFLTDNVRLATDGTRTPPDWWLTVRRAEHDRSVNRMVSSVLSNSGHSSDEETVAEDSMLGFDDIRTKLMDRLLADGVPAGDAAEVASRVARLHMENPRGGASKGLERFSQVLSQITQKQ